MDQSSEEELAGELVIIVEDKDLVEIEMIRIKRLDKERRVKLDEEEPIERILETCTKDELIYLIKDALSKVPELFESVKRLVDLNPAHRNILIHGLVRKCNRETLISVFSKYGEIEDCSVVCDNESGKSKGNGFILFKHRNGARKALQEPKKKIGNQLTFCRLSSGPVPAHKRKIFISNVSANIDPKRLTEFFARYGEFEEGPMGLDNTGKFNSYCIFVYKRKVSLRKTLKKYCKTFEGTKLKCWKVKNKHRSSMIPFPPLTTS